MGIQFTWIFITTRHIGEKGKQCRFLKVSVPLSKLSHILSGTSKWLKFGGGREGNNEGGEGEERMDPEGKEGGREGEGGCSAPFLQKGRMYAQGGGEGDTRVREKRVGRT